MLNASFIRQGSFNRPRLMAWVAALLAFVLVTHSLDTCAAHTGLPRLGKTTQVFTVSHNGAVCSALPGEACLCANCACVPFPIDSDSHQKDGCESTSEVAVRAHSVGFDFDAPLIELPVFACLPENLEAPSPLAAFLGSNGPPLTQLRNQFLTSPLSGRAPPISA